jgi:hypothetical protein
MKHGYKNDDDYDCDDDDDDDDYDDDDDDDAQNHTRVLFTDFPFRTGSSSFPVSVQTSIITDLLVSLSLFPVPSCQ